MQIREPEKQFVDDYEHRVTGKISRYGERSGFPRMEDYGVSRAELDDYLFDKQAVMDSVGSVRSQLTVGGFLTVLPVLVLSGFPNTSVVYAKGQAVATVAALALGLLIALLVRAVQQLIVRFRLARMKNPKLETYIKAVLFYQEPEGE